MSDKSCVVWFTGLAGAGKTCLANALVNLINHNGREAALIEGSAIRKVHRNDLGFSLADRRKNVIRGAEVAEVALEKGMIPVCAFISPSRNSRVKVRRLLKPSLFVEVFVSTPLEVCEQRDPNGIYSGYHMGKITNVVGFDLDYEIPECPDFIIDGSDGEAEPKVGPIIRYLQDYGII